MHTSKATIQGYSDIAVVDKKHQIIVEVKTFGEGQEQQTLKSILDGIRDRYKGIRGSGDILANKVIVTADTGFSSEDNNGYLKAQGINAHIPDNQFHSRDPKFSG